MTNIPKHLPSPYRKSKVIEEIIRVNHAGEYGAKRIYQGQLSCIKEQSAKEEIEHMLQQELVHLQYFEVQLQRRGIPRTKLQPIWHVLGFGLGVVTSMLGTKAAMACTVAVEEVIEEHYSDQLKKLKQFPEEKELCDNITQFLKEELEHRDTGIEYQAHEAKYYHFLHQFIQIASRIAIKISSKI